MTIRGVIIVANRPPFVGVLFSIIIYIDVGLDKRNVGENLKPPEDT